MYFLRLGLKGFNAHAVSKSRMRRECTESLQRLTDCFLVLILHRPWCSGVGHSGLLHDVFVSERARARDKGTRQIPTWYRCGQIQKIAGRQRGRVMRRRRWRKNKQNTQRITLYLGFRKCSQNRDSFVVKPYCTCPSSNIIKTGKEPELRNWLFPFSTLWLQEVCSTPIVKSFIKKRHSMYDYISLSICLRERIQVSTKPMDLG